MLKRPGRRHFVFCARGVRLSATDGRGGFTLTEVLIVIVVIGILAGLLMPAISSAQGRARSTQCKNNLHQIYLALEMYRNDNEGMYPYAADMPSLKLNSLSGIAEVLKEKISNVRAFKCPSDRGGYYDREGSSYEYNTKLSGRVVLGGHFEEALGETRTPVFYDYEDFHGSKQQAGARNYVYADGHVENSLAQTTDEATEEDEK